MLVSVIIPFKTDRGFLDKAIKSVQEQTYPNVELILSQSNGTVGQNLNAGIDRSTGDLICFLCDDDTLPKNSIQDRVDNFRGDFTHSKAICFYESGQVSPYNLTNPYTQFNSMLKTNGIMGGTVMYKREIFDRYKFDEGLWTAEEYDFNLRLLYDGFKLEFTDKEVYNYRIWGGQKHKGNNEYQKLRTQLINEIRNKYTR